MREIHRVNYLLIYSLSELKIVAEHMPLWLHHPGNGCVVAFGEDLGVRY
jgi:hypothetical protein